MIARISEDIDVLEWLSGQVRAGCTRLCLRSAVGRGDRRVFDWPLSAMTHLPTLKQEIEDMVCASTNFIGEAFGLFSYRPERWSHVEVALIVGGFGS